MKMHNVDDGNNNKKMRFSVQQRVTQLIPASSQVEGAKRRDKGRIIKGNC